MTPQELSRRIKVNAALEARVRGELAQWEALCQKWTEIMAEMRAAEANLQEIHKLMRENRLEAIEVLDYVEGGPPPEWMTKDLDDDWWKEEGAE